MNLPGISAAARRPSAERPANHGDLPGVIAVVRSELPQKCFEAVRPLLVTGVRGFYLTIEISWARVCKCRRFVYECGKSFLPFMPFSITGRRCGGRKAFGVMFRIWRLLAACTAKVIVHPIIHVKEKLGDRVGKAVNLPSGEFCGNIFHASQRIGVSAFAAEQFRSMRAMTWPIIHVRPRNISLRVFCDGAVRAQQSCRRAPAR